MAAEPSLRIGVVEGEAPYMFDRRWAGATLSDRRIVVIDGRSRQVRLFGRDGRVVAVQGREGEGPGEYRAPRGIDGRIVATAEIPAGMFVLEIGEDYVLGRVEDEVGVEYVTAIPLVRG